jgi:hypothetical protein
MIVSLIPVVHRVARARTCLIDDLVAARREC